MRPKTLTAAGAIAALLVAGLGGAVRAETDIVLDNRTEDVSVTTGESSFENDQDANVDSGTHFDGSETEDQGVSTTGAETQGVAAAVTPSSGSGGSGSGGSTGGSSSPTAAGNGTSQVGDSGFEDLFVGFPAISTSVAP